MTATVCNIVNRAGAPLFLVAVLSLFVISPAADALDDDYCPSPQAKRRMSEIALLRRTNAELFGAVRPYCTPITSFISRSMSPRRIVIPRAFGLEVLDPDYRSVADRCPVEYAVLKDVFDRYWRKAAECGSRDCLANEEHELRARIEKMPEASQVPRPDWAMLLVAAGHRNSTAVEPAPRLDPRYLLAWEEALLDPEVSWEMRRWLLDVVLSFQDPASTPTLGETLRAALRAELGADRLDDRPIRAIAYLLETEFLYERRSTEAARELSGTIQHVDREKQKEHLRRIGSAVEEVPEWRDLLDQMETDPEMAPHARRLREAAEFYRENKPPDTEGSDSR